MCELLGASHDEDDRDRLFTVGLFSVADALLDAPMEEVLASLPFSDEITGALLRDEGRRGRILGTVLRYEQGHFPTGEGDPVELAEAYLAALRWADRRRPLGRLMSRMPLRFKLTLAFTGVMAVLLRGRRDRAQPAGGAEPRLDDRRRARRARPRRRGGGRRAGQARQHGRAVRAGAGAGRRGARHDHGRRPAPLLSAGAARAGARRRRDRRAPARRRRPAAARPAGAQRRRRASWSWASRSPSASGRSTRCTRCCSSAARWRC